METLRRSEDFDLSIGDLSVACGINPHTLRVWERRYGRPEARRLPSGHRRYSLADVSWLRLVHELLAYGHRPSKVLKLTSDEMAALAGLERSVRTNHGQVAEWLEAFRRDGAGELRRRAEKVFTGQPLLPAVQEVIAGFVEQVGREWAEGRLEIAQEHAITEVMEDLLRTERLRLDPAKRSGPPQAILATLSGERHGLGLQMAALILANAGCPPLLLGVDLPPEEIAQAARLAGVAAVGLSVSLANSGPECTHQLRALRAALPERQELLVGGLGARAACRGLIGVQVFSELRELELWARESRHGSRG